jgi:isopentenyl-diphosphate Delta-isomerase
MMSLTARKAEHLRIAAGPGVEHAGSTGLEHVRLRHRALPERDLRDVSLRATLCGRELAAPLLVSAMTGGTAEAAEVNGSLARGAAEHGIGLVLGSGRKLLDDPALIDTYRPAPDDRPPLLLANLGAAQVRGKGGAAAAVELVDRLDADGLSVHLNPLQEAVQPEGEPDFTGVLDGIAAAVAALAPRPVVVKEVGFGLDADDVQALRSVGVAAVDVAGSGGTNWALIEGRRDSQAGGVAAAFADWGVPTAAAIVAARGATVIASGGVRDGVDAVKCLALGASAAGLARPFLLAARAGDAGAAIAAVVEQMRIATWLTGAASARELSAEHIA